MAGDIGRFLLREQGMREEEGEANRWASVVSEGREWAAGLLAQEERRGVHWAEEICLERERERARGRGLEDWAGWGGEGMKERVGPPGWVRFLSFSISFAFLIQTPLKLFEFKFKFEFNPNTQTKRTMHQHECNNKFLNIDKF